MSDWRDYENFIYKKLKESYPSSEILFNQKKLGVVSRVERQIDILVKAEIAGFAIEIIIDCKFFNKKVDVKDVESFLSYLLDLKASNGVIITNNGFTKAAQNRAVFDTQAIDLKIIEFDKLNIFQGLQGFHYKVDENGVGIMLAVQAPEGWLLDSHPKLPHTTVLYPRGLSAEEAYSSGGLIYIGFWKKDSECPNLESLIDRQNKYIKKQAFDKQEKAKISFQKLRTTNNKEFQIRTAYIHSGYLGLEYTGFIDFCDWIIFFVLLEPEDKKAKYLKKLKWLLPRVRPINIIMDKESREVLSFDAHPELVELNCPPALS